METIRQEEQKKQTAVLFKSNFFRTNFFWREMSLLAHTVLFVVAYYVAYLIRLDFILSSKFFTDFLQTLGIVVFIKVVFFSLNRHFKNDFFFASVTSMRKIVESSIFALIIFLCLHWLSDHLSEYFLFSFPIVSMSIGILVIDFGLTVSFLGGIQLVARCVNESIADRRSSITNKPAYMVGASTETARMANIINSRASTGFTVVGFVTEDKFKVKTEIDYIPVVGTFETFVSKAKAASIEHLLVVAGVLPGAKFRALFDICHASQIELNVIPASEISTSRTIPIRKLEINDLLKRDPISLHTEELKQSFCGQKILVTGAGGSIGSEICRQLLLFSPAELLILGRGENRIFFLERELRSKAENTKLIPLIANVTDAKHIDAILDKYRPDYIFHAAAHKHVPLMEANPMEAVRNNIGGTKVVVDAADKYCVKRFVLISTDKAVNPTSVMGLTKHLAERYVNAAAETSKTKFIVTRFGNVLGSNGSVVPIFQEQIKRGGPITITDLRMTRFFMTIPEATQLVLEASVMGNGGEIFVLDMGQPVHIAELARDLIRLSGLPDGAIEIKEVGLRPGEKLYEELYFDSEQKINTTHPKLYAARHREFKRDVVRAQIQEIIEMAEQTADAALLRMKFKELVPEYQMPVSKE